MFNMCPACTSTINSFDDSPDRFEHAQHDLNRLNVSFEYAQIDVNVHAVGLKHCKIRLAMPAWISTSVVDDARNKYMLMIYIE